MQCFSFVGNVGNARLASASKVKRSRLCVYAYVLLLSSCYPVHVLRNILPTLPNREPWTSTLYSQHWFYLIKLFSNLYQNSLLHTYTKKLCNQLCISRIKPAIKIVGMKNTPKLSAYYHHHKAFEHFASDNLITGGILTTCRGSLRHVNLLACWHACFGSAFVVSWQFWRAGRSEMRKKK